VERTKMKNGHANAKPPFFSCMFFFFIYLLMLVFILIFLSEKSKISFYN
jgi:hypothetical protein